MHNLNNDTIAAIATPQGRGGIGIIRISGPKAFEIASKITKKEAKIRQAIFTNFYTAQGDILDEGLALFFQNPQSFTGEDVVELQGHGSPVVLALLLQNIYTLGARPARPGEFSERAFLNDKLDLVQAEAIADLIDASSTKAARLAVRNLQGHLSQKINALQTRLTYLRVYVEASIDFPEEDIDFIQSGKILEQLQVIIQEGQVLLTQMQQGKVYQEGLTIVLAGVPNAGKSTLLNALSGRDAAIVTDIPGTTRDILRERVLIEGVPCLLVDTAGLRESNDPIEQEGIRRALKEIEVADHLFILTDIEREASVDAFQQEITQKLPRAIPYTVIINKNDQPNTNTHANYLYISAKYHLGLDALKAHILNIAGLDKGSEEHVLMARGRHIHALELALELIETGCAQVQAHQALELLSEDLRQAQKSLSEITGEMTSDMLLGEIFSSFCIGK